jgi:hypothetical protein
MGTGASRETTAWGTVTTSPTRPRQTSTQLDLRTTSAAKIAQTQGAGPTLATLSSCSRLATRSTVGLSRVAPSSPSRYAALALPLSHSFLHTALKSPCATQGKIVKLKQADNSSCFHRLYYYAQCFTNGEGPGRSLSCEGQQCRGRNPTSIENVGLNATDNAPGTFYYDRAGATISYVPREGETIATLEATATTATQQELVTLTGASNVRWEGVHFAYGTWLDASGPKGYIDTQSGYQCQAVANSQDGEPPTNVAISGSLNITVVSCAFSHLGAVYALGADGASQSIIVSNCTFDDLSGGAVKLGK